MTTQRQPISKCHSLPQSFRTATPLWALLPASPSPTAQPQLTTAQSPFHPLTTQPRRRLPPRTSFPAPLPESRCSSQNIPRPTNDPILALLAIQTPQISQVQCHTMASSLGQGRTRVGNRTGSIGEKLDLKHLKRDLEPYLLSRANPRVVAINDPATLECLLWLCLRMNRAKRLWNGL